MMKSFGKIALLGAAVAASLTLTGTAFATTFSGSAYCDIATNSGGQGSGYAILTPTISQLGAAESSSAGLCASFTGTSINFATGSDSTSGGTSLNSFLTYGGPLTSVAYYALPGANMAPATTATGSQDDSGTLIVLQGATYLTANEAITLSHDDGAYIYVCPLTSTCNYATGAGFSVISGEPSNSGVQTVAGQPAFTYGGATGAYDFELIYNSNYLQPSQLSSNINITPEPSSLLMLGTGLVSAAGMMFRRRATV